VSIFSQTGKRIVADIRIAAFCVCSETHFREAAISNYRAAAESLTDAVVEVLSDAADKAIKTRQIIEQQVKIGGFLLGPSNYEELKRELNPKLFI